MFLQRKCISATTLEATLEERRKQRITFKIMSEMNIQNSEAAK